MPARNWNTRQPIQSPQPPKGLWRPPAPLARVPFRLPPKVDARPVATLCAITIPFGERPERGWPTFVLRREYRRQRERWLNFAIKLLDHMRPKPHHAPLGFLVWFSFGEESSSDYEREIGGFKIKVNAAPMQSTMKVYDDDEELVLWLQLRWKRGQYVFRTMTYDEARASATAVCLTLAVA